MAIKDPYDRTVHAILADGTEIARYDRAGKWYAEPVGYGTAKDVKRRAISLSEAVELSSAADAKWRENRPGGQVFDARMRTAATRTK